MTLQIHEKIKKQRNRVQYISIHIRHSRYFSHEIILRTGITVHYFQCEFRNTFGDVEYEILVPFWFWSFSWENLLFQKLLSNMNKVWIVIVDPSFNKMNKFVENLDWSIKLPNLMQHCFSAPGFGKWEARKDPCYLLVLKFSFSETLH